MRLLSTVVLAATLLGPGGAPVSSPGSRNAHAMAYDERRHATVLYGGADASSVRGDTWSWDGDRWRALEIAGPSPRTFPALVWDAARAEAVLFGGRKVLFGHDGQRDTCLSDTWVLRTDGWHHPPVAGPPPRSEAGIAYDRDRRAVIVFGGYNDVGGETVRLGDTWEWDGTAWTLRAQSGPVPRSGVAMAYDQRLHRTILFGGNGGPRGDTWMWDGARWELATAANTPPRFNSLAQYDSARHELVRTTGWDGAARVRELWLFQAMRWTLKSSEGPSARNHSAIAFDRRRGRLVLYGGHDGTLVFGDTWEWDGRGWIERMSAPPQPRVENNH